MSEFIEYTVPRWRGLDMRDLKVDEAYLLLKNFYNETAYLYSLSDTCVTCPYTKVEAIQPRPIDNDKLEPIKLNVAQGITMKIFDTDLGKYALENDTAICGFYRRDMQEFGVYNLTLYENRTCEFSVDKSGVNINLSLLSVFILIGLILGVLKISWCAWRSYRYDEEAHIVTEQVNAAVSSGQKNRLKSLDAFRGLAIVLMIFVNSGGGEYWWIDHAKWNGLHIADIVFPSFLWIMGVCIPITVRSQMARGISKSTICRRIIWRSIKLFAIGLCLNSLGGNQLEKLRIMGVLQRFGVGYLVCGVIHTIFSKTREQLLPQAIWKRSIYDLILLKGEFLVMLALIATHLSITFGLNVPGCPKGYLGPGGKANYGLYPNCTTGGATGYIDLIILGNSHLYQHPTSKLIYGSKAFDPEGLFGCLLTIVQVFIGIIAGTIILVHISWSSRITRWMCWSIVLALLGGILCEFSKEGGIIPINKNLWSLSYVCVTTSLAFLILSILYFTIDVNRWWNGFPFVEAGMNSILMFVGHTIMHKMLPWHWRIGEMNTHFVLLLESVWNTALWIGIAIYLDSINFYYSL